MIRAGTRAAMLLGMMCSEPMSTEQLLDRLMERTGVAVDRKGAEYGMRVLRAQGLAFVVRPGKRGHVAPPGLYALTPLGERELDRLFTEARL